MKILNILHDSIVDGTGLRTVIFFSGCPHRCKGCHNPQSWNIDYGYDYTSKEVIDEITSNKATQGITLSGGDPFYQAKEIVGLVKELRDFGYDIWAYTGWLYEYIVQDKDMFELLKFIDVLIEEQKDLLLRFKGSKNQRIIDVQKSLQENKVILYMD